MSKRPDGALLDMLRVDRGSANLLYRQIFDGLRELILSGRLASGTRLPSTRELTNDLKVSRNTVRQAFDQLIAEGYLQGRDGSGTYVAADLPDVPLQPPEYFADLTSAEKPGGVFLSKRSRRITSDLVTRGFSEARPFSPSLPALDHFPVESWTRSLMRQWRRGDSELLGYGDLAGYQPLREAIASYLGTTRGVSCRWQQIIIVSGAQQAFNLLVDVLLDPGEGAWLEEPGNIGLRGIVTAAGAKPLPVPVDKFGFNVIIGRENYPDARIAFVTPSHQYPLGVTMPLSRRLEVLAWAYQTGGWVVEDDYDNEFRYSGNSIPALQGLDRHERVIYVGSFNKVLSPALRLGYLVVPTQLIEPLTLAVGILDKGHPTHTQAALADFIQRGHLATHIRRMRKICMERQRALLNAVHKNLHGLLEVSPTNSGLHLVGWLPDEIDDVSAYESAMSRGIETYPLSRYYMTPLPSRGGLMMGFACATPEEIARATGVLAAALNGCYRTAP